MITHGPSLDSRRMVADCQAKVVSEVTMVE